MEQAEPETVSRDPAPDHNQSVPTGPTQKNAPGDAPPGLEEGMEMAGDGITTPQPGMEGEQADNRRMPDDASHGSEPDIFYVSQKALDKVHDKLEKRGGNHQGNPTRTHPTGEPAR